MELQHYWYEMIHMPPPWILTRKMFLSEEEVERLLSELQQRAVAARKADRQTALTDQLIINAILFSGLRNSEFCRLRVADTVVATGQSVFNVRGTPRQDRMAHVSEFVSDLVAEYVAEVRPQQLAEEIDPEDQLQSLVFNERRRPYERTALCRRVVRILTAVGLRDRASVQLLRHTYGYLGYKRTGGNLLFLQRQLGHAHPMVTNVYAQFVDESYADLANVVGGRRPNSRLTSRRSKPSQMDVSLK